MIAGLAEQLEDRGIYCPASRGKHRTACPECGRGPSDDTLSVTIDDGARWKCFRCDFKGGLNGKKANGHDHGTPKYTTLADWGRDIWDRCQPITPGTVAAKYLEGRGCTIPAGDHLRWHPNLENKADKHKGPALVALITDIETGEAISLHRTWIAKDGTGKAAIDHPRLVLKDHRTDGVVRLTPHRGLLAIGEGLETCLHWCKATGGSAWAAIDAGNLAKFPVLDDLTRLSVLVDNDKPNPKNGKRAGQDAARAVLRRYRDTGVDLYAIFPPTEGHDAADLTADEMEQARMTGADFLRATMGAANPIDSEAMDLAGLAFTEPPPRVWVWDGWILQGRAHYLNGPGGSCKSLLCQMLGTASVLGRETFGVETLQGPVVGVWGEDDHDEIWRRQVAINRRFNASMLDLQESGLCWIPTARDITFFTAGAESDFAITEEFEKFKELIERRKPGLAIIDGVTLIYEGPEGKRALVTRVMRALDEVAQKNKCAVVVIGHNNKMGEFSGSTAFENAVRARLSMERIETDEGGEALRLSLPKANYNGKQHIDLRFSDGSLAAIDDEHMSSTDRLDRDLRRGAADQLVLDGVDRMTQLERTLSASNRASNYAPKILHPAMMPHDFTIKELEKAMERLIVQGRLEPRARLPFKVHNRTATGLGRPAEAAAQGAAEGA